MEHRTLNLVLDPDFLIFTDFASLRRAVRRKSLISLICLGCGWRRGGGRERDGRGQPWFGGVAAGEGAVACRAPREKNRVPVRDIARRRAPGTPVEDVARDPDADATRATRRERIPSTVAAADDRARASSSPLGGSLRRHRRRFRAPNPKHAASSVALGDARGRRSPRRPRRRARVLAGEGHGRECSRTILAELTCS